MHTVLVTLAMIAVTALTIVLTLVLQALLVMAVLRLASKAARCRPQEPAREAGLAELRLLATGPQNSSRE